MHIPTSVEKMTAKKSMHLKEFKITAWQDEEGLMRLEIQNTTGKDVFHGLNLPWERDAFGGRVAFTSNPNIIEAECYADSDDRRESPRFLREAGRDPVFRAWFMKSRKGRNSSPEILAKEIEEIRHEEGRDPETGAILVVSPDPRRQESLSGGTNGYKQHG